MIDRAQIKEIAKYKFKQRYGMCVGAALLIILLGGESNISYGPNFSFGLPDEMQVFVPFIVGIGFIAMLVYLLVGAPLRVGNAQFTRCIYNDWQTSVGDMFRRGFDDYGRNLGGILWMQLFIFLWSLLFVIPGIVKSYAYFATPYILSEFPAVKPTDAIKISMRMTKGFKGELFVLDLSFLGWNLLSMLTLGLLGILYVNPYYHASKAGFYEVIKANALNTGAVSWWELTGYPGGEGGRAGY
ncbi:MAG: DUF975 family protein [Christensenellaceae bacterium]|nr:DUF975 family protein [Christensenellaceae bacterium]